MKKSVTVLILFIVGLAVSVGGHAERAWIGDTKIEKISFLKSSTGCSPSAGACLILYFSEGYKGCESISIRESDIHFNHIVSMAYISYSSGKAFRAYGSNEYCNDADKIAINNATLL